MRLRVFWSVGAATETEMKEAKLRMEDALNATRAAVEEGVIAGGGSAYIHATKQVAKLVDTLEGDVKTGAQIFVERSLLTLRDYRKSDVFVVSVTERDFLFVVRRQRQTQEQENIKCIKERRNICFSGFRVVVLQKFFVKWIF